MPDAGSIALIGGHLSLDFANTAGWHASDERSEWLTSYPDVVAWARHAQAISPAAADTLQRAAQDNPRLAARTLKRVIDLREAVYRTFAAIAGMQVPAASDLEALHAAHVAALAAADPRWMPNAGFVVQWSAQSDDLALPIYPIMVQVMELLGSPDLAKLRQCGRHPCGWLFLDRSRNGSRRWCSSSECGNATRVARFRERDS